LFRHKGIKNTSCVYAELYMDRQLADFFELGEFLGSEVMGDLGQGIGYELG